MRFVLGLVAVAGLLAACGDDGRDELESLAKQQALCETADDCCVVVDECMATAYVVGVDDYHHARDVAAGLDDSECAKCVTPRVGLSCIEGQCVGSYTSVDGDRGDHCGPSEPIDSPAPEGSSTHALTSGRILGCGGDGSTGPVDQPAPPAE